MNVAIVHNSITEDEGPDAKDVLAQVAVVRDALVQSGHSVEVLPCSLNLEQIVARLRETRTEMVFNLVESLDGHGRLIHLFPALLEALRLPYTGSSAAAIATTSNKTEAKEVLRHAGLPTPAWIGPMVGRGGKTGGTPVDGVWIVKSQWEHASLGMDAESVLQPESAAALFSILEQRAGSLGGSCFGEQFIDGREFNIALLAAKNEVEVLPAAEILFDDFSTHMPRIVDYSAKWDETSFAYGHTPRRYDFSEDERPLLEKLVQLSKQCWHLFNLKGYARVDFRVDRDGQPWILEVNTNPCLSPDAGFAAALDQAGLSFTEAVGRILEDSLLPPHA
ncbi:MAG: ATP-grasp domain-containing protein [Proteobacteria bacterium]|nr:ATP-grasp domain-containing protein [Pseudomonadota bacterium]MBU1060680.1 ATP-grasp domain-containing protein [Pseudomonadota bacterium]